MKAVKSFFSHPSSKSEFLFSSLVIGVLILSSALLTTSYLKTQLASLTSSSCYLQAEVDTKGAEKTNLEKQLASTQDKIDATSKGITDNWSALTEANQKIKDLTPTIVSDYTITQKTTEVNTLFTQLTASKALDAQKTQILAATSGANAAKAKSVALYPQVQSAYTLTNSMLNRANAARNSPTYTTLYNQYRTQLGKYNTLNAQYNAVLGEYNAFVTLNTKYSEALKQYRAKYYPNLTTTATLPTTASLQTQYNTLNTALQKLISDNNNTKTQITTLTAQAASYTSQDITLNKEVSNLTASLSTLKNQIRDLDITIATYKGNICPLKESICNNSLDDDRDGTQDCGDVDCATDVACKATSSCGDNVCSAGENHDNCPADCAGGTGSTVTYFPPNGVLVDSGLSELTATFPDEISYSGGTISVFENGVASDIGATITATTHKVTVSLTSPLKPNTVYSVNANLDLGGGNQWMGNWAFRTAEGGGGGGISGCTGAGADNYNPSATVDDGSCTYSNGGKGQEICGNGVDDNSNGFADCADPACSTTLACNPVDCDDSANCGKLQCVNSDVCKSDAVCPTEEIRKIDIAGEISRRAEAISILKSFKSSLEATIASKIKEKNEALENNPNADVSSIQQEIDKDQAALRSIQDEITRLYAEIASIPTSGSCPNLRSLKSSLGNETIDADAFIADKMDV